MRITAVAWGFVLVALGALATCAPAAPPTAPAAPAKPAAVGVPAPPAAAVPPAAAWQAEWDRVLAAAHQEGKVVVAGPPGQRYREAIGGFERAYPGIQLEFTGGFGRDHIPRILEERRNGIFNWDVYVGGSSNAFDLQPAGALQPLKPALILPSVLDDSKWFGGFDDGFHDRAKQFAHGFLGYLSFSVFVNRDVVPESELSSIDQLVDSRWKGQISWQDPRVTGAGATVAGQLLLLKGEDFYRRLLSQDVVAILDARQQAEQMVRGRYPIGLGVSSDRLAEFQDQGLGKNIQPLEPRGPAGARVSSGFGVVMLMDRPPNPNAQKVFANWLLDKDAQALLAKASDTNSRRLDVDGPADTALYPGVERRTVNDEEYFEYESRARDVAREIIR